MRVAICPLSMIGLLFILNSSVFAQSVLKGRVTDESLRPLGGATVMIHQVQVGTVTRPDGTFQIALPEKLRSLSVEFSFVGYRSKLQNMVLTEGENFLEIVLSASSIELQEITVTAGFVQENELLPYPITSYTKKDLERSGGINLSQSLARLPGVYVTSLGNGVGKPVVRGLSNANIIMLNNGIKLENFNFSSTHPFLVDEFNADRIEVIKGATSLQYGSDAVGGVVNVVRERPTEPKKMHGEFISLYHTNTNGYVNSLRIKGSGKTFFYGVRGSLKSHKDYRDGGGVVVRNTRFSEENLTANAGMRTNFGVFFLNYNYTTARYSLQNQNTLNLFHNSTAASLLSNGRENQVWYQDLKHHLITSNNTLYLGKTSLEFDLAYQQNRRQGIGGGLTPQGSLAIPVLASMQLSTLTYNAKMVVSEGNRKLIFGFNGAKIWNEADETKPNNPLLDSKMDDVGLFAIGDFSFNERLTLTSGLRFDHRTMKSYPTQTQTSNQFKVNKSYNVVNGSTGITFKVAQSNILKLNVSKGFRTPTMPELTQNGIHSGRFERGNVELKPQDNFQLDLNYHLHYSWIVLEVTPFYNKVNNYIYLVRTTEDAPLGGGKIFQHVQNDAVLRGGEVILDLHPVKWFGIHVNYSLVRANISGDSDGNKYPTFIPQDRISSEIKFERHKISFMNNPYLSLEALHYLKQSRTGQNEAVTPAYTLFNARMGTSISLGKQELEVFVVGNNLSNTAYVDHLSVSKQLNLKMMGRNLMFGLRLPFDVVKGTN